MPSDYTDEPTFLRHLQVFALLAAGGTFVVAIAIIYPGLLVFLGEKTDPYEGRAIFLSLSVGLPLSLGGIAFSLYAASQRPDGKFLRLGGILGACLNLLPGLAWLLAWIYRS